MGQIHEMFRFSLACLVGVATAANYDHDQTLMKPRPAAFNVGGETHIRGQDVVFNLDSYKTSISAIAQGFSTFDITLSEALEAMEETDVELGSSIDTLRIETDALMKSVNVDFEAFKVKTVAAQNTLQAAFDSGVSKLATSAGTTGQSMKSSYNAKFADLNAKLSALSKVVDTKVSALDGVVNSKFSEYQSDYNNKINAANAVTAGVVTEMAATTKSFKTKQDEKAILWIGGMRGHMYSGWRTMEFNRVELDAKAAHFEVHNSYFKVKHAGIYRICLWTIHYGLGGIRYMVRINGSNMMSEGHSEGGDRYGGRRGWWRWYWEDTHIDQTWHFKVNEKVEIRMYSPSYSLHGDSSRNAHNRVSFTFVGENKENLRM